MRPLSAFRSSDRIAFKIAPTELPSYEEDDLDHEDHERPSHPTVHRIPRAMFMLVAALVVTIWMLLFVILSPTSWLSSSHTFDYWSKDIIPKGDPFAYRFVETYNYSRFDPSEVAKLYRKYWKEDMYAVAVKDPKKYGLLPGYPTLRDDHIEAYNPSFIHQFHCLVLFRENWWEMRRRIGRDPYNTSPLVVDEPEDERLDHVEHCLDYLRQTVACWADTTLEGPAVHPDGQRTNTDGMNYQHKCYNMDTVYKNYRDKAELTRFVRPGDPLLMDKPGQRLYL